MPISFGFVSTYPPTHCGLATFTSALFAELTDAGDDSGRVVRLVDSKSRTHAPEVVAELVEGDPNSLSQALSALADCDVVIVQHEYGVFGGVDGDEAVTLLRALTVPSIVVLHTVLSEPTAHQRSVLEEVAAAADAVVTMTATARERLAGYDVDLSKVFTIPHGAVPPVMHSPVFRTGEPTILTWGLIGPGKGIEWAIAAMPALADLPSKPHYIVAGQTHPKVILREGEAYRTRLLHQIKDLGLERTVNIDGRYRGAIALGELVRSADVVLLPYDSTDQVTSGVLIEAVAAGKPVVATRFPHAVELLSNGAGILVPHRDPTAIAEALRTLLTHPQVRDEMSKAALGAVPDLLWSAVAMRYRLLAERLMVARAAA